MDAKPNDSSTADAQSGLIATVGAFIIWGLFPLYWRFLEAVPAVQIIAHRIAWCAVFVVALLLLRRGTGWIGRLLKRRRLLAVLALSSLLISFNWGLFIWAVNHGHVVDISLGYFINPLINVVLGVLVLGERVNRRQGLAVAVAASGVAFLTWKAGGLPWIALSLAFSFATYGLLRKLADVDPIEGLAVEAGYWFVPVLIFLIWLESSGQGVFGHASAAQGQLLALGGFITAIPLILFAYGARRVNYITVGFIQYLGPTLHLLIGVFLFGEAFGWDRAVGFMLIWSALVIYAGDGIWRLRLRGHG